MGNKPSRIDRQSIDLHNETTAKSRIKILLFGSNTGKSQWFNGRRDNEFISKIQSYITFRIKSFTIGDKLPEIKTVIYDTPHTVLYFKDTLKYIPSADALILTYNIHNIDSLYFLEECMNKIQQTIQKHTPCLLLGIHESETHNENAMNYVDDAQQFAVKYNLFHLEIDITQNINATEPYLYLLRKILNQKQKIFSPWGDHKVHALRPCNRPMDNKPDLMPYTFRAFSAKNTETETLESIDNIANIAHNDNVWDILSAINVTYEDEKVNNMNNMDQNDDSFCQLEFERFFEVSMGTQRNNKYMNEFKEKQYNDIRLIDPDIFDDDWFKSGEIEMNLLDKKLFKKEIQKYKTDYVRFENMLFMLNMTEKYHKQFVQRGIATFWSFYYHVRSVDDIEDIIKNKQDAMLIWNELNIMNENKEQVIQIEGHKKMVKVPTLQWVPKDMDVDVGNSSDSDELYTKPNHKTKLIT